MQLEYYGHSFWRVVTGEVKVVLDPFENIGYPMPANLSADYVFISHGHHDHSNASLIKGNPVLVKTPGIYTYPGLKANVIQVYHDEKHGADRGLNNITKLEMEGITLVHCGDLGQVPDAEKLKEIYQPDLLLVPVGENYTMPLPEVWKLINLIKPRLIFPMHYKTSAVAYKLTELDVFLKDATNVVKHPTFSIEVDSALLAENRTIVMNWKH